MELLASFRSDFTMLIGLPLASSASIISANAARAPGLWVQAAPDRFQRDLKARATLRSELPSSAALTNSPVCVSIISRSASSGTDAAACRHPKAMRCGSTLVRRFEVQLINQRQGGRILHRLIVQMLCPSIAMCGCDRSVFSIRHVPCSRAWPAARRPSCRAAPPNRSCDKLGRDPPDGSLKSQISFYER